MTAIYREYSIWAELEHSFAWAMITFDLCQYAYWCHGYTQSQVIKRHYTEPPHINSLPPSGTIWQHTPWSTLAQVMACCLTAPSHNLNQCWLHILVQSTIQRSPRDQWLKTFPPIHIYCHGIHRTPYILDKHFHLRRINRLTNNSKTSRWFLLRFKFTRILYWWVPAKGI